MFIKLWFWSLENPVPRVIAHGDGNTLVGAAAGCFAPVSELGWRREYVGDEQLYLIAKNRPVGYLAEVVHGDDSTPGPLRRFIPAAAKAHQIAVEAPTSPRERPRTRERLTTVAKPGRQRLGPTAPTRRRIRLRENMQKRERL